ncbi:myelin P2 protein isoform X1 [Cataglyphis hispanica]|uniref:myelin P2 protein isoform X1 n=1 Tax=Cataglyphis hispanica TaxID=1086592 RepID=UPI00217FBEB7|nr:myelin P2 protein isoform X1 [Cataglyphis hispanica]
MSSEILSGILGKRYKLVTSEKFDEYMKALGVGMVTRKMGATVSPVVELTEKDGVYTLKTTSTFKNTEIKFKLGEEFDEDTVDGRKVKSVCTLEGNKLIQVQKGDKNTTIEREFTPTEMKAIMKVDDIVCTRVYKIQE